MQEEILYTEAQLLDWKKEFGKIYKTVIGDQVVVWRKLRRQEYKKIMGDNFDAQNETEKVYSRQEAISQTVLLWPDDKAAIVEQNAGLAAALSDEVILRSGFEVEKTEEL